VKCEKAINHVSDCPLKAKVKVTSTKSNDSVLVCYSHLVTVVKDYDGALIVQKVTIE
jgi:hypothetical protein